MSVPIELKVNVDGEVDAALAGLEVVPRAAAHRDIWFADLRAGVHAGEPPLFARNVVIRLRSGDGANDLTVKIRPAATEQLVGPWATSFENPQLTYRIEGDTSLGGCDGTSCFDFRLICRIRENTAVMGKRT